uniref:Uncharacterized protein n=1 Tax=Skeletonema marinoi TaxID=267567 RepID=A0A7S2PVZ1_9STRA|mmetsp:Transcript_33988/g.57416  ORF Transcript_33988/g.57416 Transcript_33988/m.57416 type:complete len:141 (+) Transcript_33988:83-505(+)
MFDLSNYFTAMTSSKTSSSSSSDETASTSSVSSDSTPDTTTSSRNDGVYNNNQAKHKHKDPPSNASNDDYINDEEQEVLHIPPKIAFQIFELIELKRRYKGLYRRHQEKRRQSVIKANNASYHSVTSAFESYCVDGELFV